jgi:GDP/UDP-N,N'-diacetylbacillosamine 2-epimerase (hydrolysing)
VIHCDPNKTEIETAITKLLSSDFQVRLKQTQSPFGVGGASEKIVEILKDWRVNNLLQKEFYDYGVDRP